MKEYAKPQISLQIESKGVKCKETLMPAKLSKKQVQEFRKEIQEYYRKEGRNLPWRENVTPYRIVVSEIMLQQTQVPRVALYYPKFLKAFPDWRTLAGAPLKKILSIWQGLGYNRRPLYLQKMAREIVRKHHGRLPRSADELAKLPGIGEATAGAIIAYAYNLPSLFIETNIRRTFIHWFFKKRKMIHDREILPLLEQTLDRKNPREWYWALTDYGATLGRNPSKISPNPNRKSKHYFKQSRFEGSRRQIRGQILRLLLHSPLTLGKLSHKTGKSKIELKGILLQLSREGFIEKCGDTYHI